MEQPKIMSLAEAAKLLKGLECLPPGLPRSAEGIESLSKAFIDIVGTRENGAELISKLVRGVTRFPTPLEMRRIWCRANKPADGLEDREVDVSAAMQGKKFEE
jgi:hypothetical protein